jgi:hypothetical protein
MFYIHGLIGTGSDLNFTFSRYRTDKSLIIFNLNISGENLDRICNKRGLFKLEISHDIVIFKAV